MTFTVLQNGVDAVDADVMMENLTNIVYTILWNRMEQDKAGMVQLTPNMQSDIFTDADGCYNTICTSCTTSLFSNNNYINICSYNSPQFCKFYSCAKNDGCLECIGTCTYNDIANENLVKVYASGAYTPEVTVCYCNDLCLMDYRYIGYIGCYSFLLCINNSNCIGHSCAYINFSTCCVNCTSCYNLTGCSGAYTFTAPICVEYCYCNGCYNVYCNGACTNSINMNTLCITAMYSMCANYRGISCLGYVFACMTCFPIIFVIKNTANLEIDTKLKNYSTLKNAFMFETNSIVPSGNCISAKVYNQNNDIYLDDAAPGCLYNLSANDSCCFRVELWQCVSCGLCNPQCMTQYSLIFM